MTEPLRLEVRRRIAAPPERLFEAWTEPAQLLAWWGPRNVDCTLAEVDLRVGGRYRLGDALPDGREMIISGEFLVVDPPHALAYSWSLDPDAAATERVTVRFEPHGTQTEVVVVHERIADEPSREAHAQGWAGCLDGLTSYLAERG